MNVTVEYADLPTPLGLLRVATNRHALLALEFDTPEALGELSSTSRDLVGRLRDQVDRYFAGERVVFDLPLAPAGTPFQHEVWQALRGIPYGETVSYAAIAARVGRPSAVRAVGAANGRNPIAIIVPCHRVIGTNGTLTGYAGGLERKRALLALEAPAPLSRFAA